MTLISKTGVLKEIILTFIVQTLNWMNKGKSLLSGHQQQMAGLWKK